MHEYEGVRRVVFGTEDGYYDGATFIPVCPKCGRFVKPGLPTFQNDTVADVPNARCSKCGPVCMLFEGFL